MTIRSIEPEDVEEIKRIHEKHFKDEFLLHDFLSNHHCVFVVSDDTGIVVVSGIRPIAEVVVITNKDRSVNDRMHAFYKHLEANIFVAQSHGYDQLHCFVQDPKWSKRIQKSFGFAPTRGQALVLDV